MQRSIKSIAVLLLLVTLASAAEAQESKASGLSADLLNVKSSLEKYQDPIVAIRDGYLSTLVCASFTDGAMGVHFINLGTIGPTVDPQKPQVLMYEPVDGKLKLVGAEWFVPLATGVKERPTLFGQPFDGPMDGHEPIMPASLKHYDLHVWLFKENPDGPFAPANKAVNCPEGPYTGHANVSARSHADTHKH